ncbi:MAG: hypothetical protein AAGA56_28510, partial [Myxococcota bacterium]
ATASPPAPETEEYLTEALQHAFTFVQVTPLRLREALYRYCGQLLTQRERWLLAMLTSGRAIDPRGRQAFLTRQAMWVEGTGSFRRMSEQSSGVRPAGLQTPPPLLSPEQILELVMAESEEVFQEAGGTQPWGGSSPDLDLGYDSAAPEDDTGRITQPYATDQTEDDDADETGYDRRNTQPWREADASEQPVSVPGEFQAQLSEPTDNLKARVDENKRRFRHRGPFTRAQAELAVAEADDVNLVLEILLRYGRQFFERTILFGVTENQLELRLAHGLSSDLADMSVPLFGTGVLHRAVLEGVQRLQPLSHEGTDNMIRASLGIRADVDVAVVPLTIRDRAVAVFFGDDRDYDVDGAAVEDVHDFADLCAVEITRIILDRKRRA